MREHEINEALNHPRIVKQFDTIEIDNTSFGIVLELCEGPSLDIYLKQHGALTEKEAKVVIWQILTGLKYLYDQPKKIIHYDLKPQNILFHRGEVKISDFGLAKIIEENKSNIELTSQGVGTYWYLPPECFDTGVNTTISPTVDIWSVGVIFYEMLYGAKPFGQNMTQERILKEDAIRNSGPVVFPERKDISLECKSFIKKCLERSPCNRMNVVQALEGEYMMRGAKKLGGTSCGKLRKLILHRVLVKVVQTNIFKLCIEMQGRVLGNCKLHAGQKLKKFCESPNCWMQICPKCALEMHKGHRVIAVSYTHLTLPTTPYV
eukprot:TRINITY_DN2854_c0_g1_i4.p1 TRINITY_DN2854_c0_g1~~TRINITY_DN2854_c0_g1_i4.p1  ORF type:complete len:320 (-),score=76.18 TRINITY_DN2854_c0_g1_i4:54-1013(-)